MLVACSGTWQWLSIPWTIKYNGVVFPRHLERRPLRPRMTAAPMVESHDLGLSCCILPWQLVKAQPVDPFSFASCDAELSRLTSSRWFAALEAEKEEGQPMLPDDISMKGIRLHGAPLYLDAQSTTPLDPRVLDKMLPWMIDNFGNPHSRTHLYGWEAEDAVEKARAQVT